MRCSVHASPTMDMRSSRSSPDSAQTGGAWTPAGGRGALQGPSVPQVALLTRHRDRASGAAWAPTGAARV